MKLLKVITILFLLSASLSASEKTSSEIQEYSKKRITEIILSLRDTDETIEQIGILLKLLIENLTQEEASKIIDEEGTPIFHYLLEYEELLKLFLSNDIDITDKNGNTALMKAAEPSISLSVFKKIMSFWPDTTLKNKENKTVQDLLLATLKIDIDLETEIKQMSKHNFIGEHENHLKEMEKTILESTHNKRYRRKRTIF